MAVVAEIAPLKFKFEVHALPAPGSDLAFRLAIGETGLNGFGHVAQVFRDHPKKEHDAPFVDREILAGLLPVCRPPGSYLASRLESVRKWFTSEDLARLAEDRPRRKMAFRFIMSHEK